MENGDKYWDLEPTEPDSPWSRAGRANGVMDRYGEPHKQPRTPNIGPEEVEEKVQGLQLVDKAVVTDVNQAILSCPPPPPPLLLLSSHHPLLISSSTPPHLLLISSSFHPLLFLLYPPPPLLPLAMYQLLAPRNTTIELGKRLPVYALVDIDMSSERGIPGY